MNPAGGAYLIGEGEFAQVVPRTVAWLERAVMGLNLCPFAKGVHVKGQIHYVVTEADNREDLLQVLREELLALVALDPSMRDTTLLIAPLAFPEFWDFNTFLPECDKLLKREKLQGIVQIASFHPRFEFVGAEPNDITNYTNRSPYPILHLLREDSIDRAVQAFAQAEEIFEKNMQTLQALGQAGWDALGLYDPHKPIAQQPADSSPGAPPGTKPDSSGGL